MSITRTYRCNLCNDMHEPKYDEIVGVYFTGSYTESEIEFRHPNQTEHHICVRCLNQLKSLEIPKP